MLPQGIDSNDLSLPIARHGAAGDHVGQINKTSGFNAWFSLAAHTPVSLTYEQKNFLTSCGYS